MGRRRKEKDLEQWTEPPTLSTMIAQHSVCVYEGTCLDGERAAFVPSRGSKHKDCRPEFSNYRPLTTYSDGIYIITLEEIK